MVSLIHQLVEKQVLNYPQSIAVSCSNKFILYKDLNERANQLANFLKAQGVIPETLVGISIDRSLEMIIAILGILKAGGAYVPIDPHYPQERIDFMLSDSNISILLTQESMLEQFHSINAKKICLDSEWKKIQVFSKSNNFPTTTNSDNLAYVLYTSGSTGIPKGVMVCHKNLIHAYSGWERAYKLTNFDCHLQMANFSFDVFTGDWIRALCFGGKLVLCPRDTLLNPEKLYQLMLEEKINCAEFVPAVLRKLFEHIETLPFPLKFMRLLICGSDSWSMHEYRKAQHLCSEQARVISSYGLTEATIDSTYFEDKLSESDRFCPTDSVPIGKPFWDTEIFLLDEKLNNVPNGSSGEIYIGGKGISRGYLNQPKLSEQKFIKHSFNNNSEIKLYKTGDQGRCLPDGNIAFLGRIDNQVKLRGMRIELSDIENALSCYPDIKESLVILNEDNPQHQQLVAYLVVKTGISLDITAARKFLKNKLPRHMIPSIFIRLNSLPLTPNGKIDRQALRQIDKLPLLDKNYTAPRNLIEAQLVNSWQKLLKVEKIGIFDDFFDLGGDSFLLAILLQQIEKDFFISIQLCDLPHNITIDSLANLVNKTLTANAFAKS